MTPQPVNRTSSLQSAEASIIECFLMARHLSQLALCTLGRRCGDDRELTIRRRACIAPFFCCLSALRSSRSVRGSVANPQSITRGMTRLAVARAVRTARMGSNASRKANIAALAVVLLLVCAAVSSVSALPPLFDASAVDLPPPPAEPLGSLVHVQIQHRHGDRSPVHVAPAMAQVWQRKGLRPGQLSSIGAAQLAALGRFLRKTYISESAQLLRCRLAELLARALADCLYCLCPAVLPSCLRPQAVR